MLFHQGLTLYPLTPAVIAARPDLDPWQRDERILRSRGGWIDFEGRQHPPRGGWIDFEGRQHPPRGGWIDFEGHQHPPRLIRNVWCPGDALYFWDGPWGTLSGSRGIAVVRDGQVVETFTTVVT